MPDAATASALARSACAAASSAWVGPRCHGVILGGCLVHGCPGSSNVGGMCALELVQLSLRTIDRGLRHHDLFGGSGLYLPGGRGRPPVPVPVPLPKARADCPTVPTPCLRQRCHLPSRALQRRCLLARLRLALCSGTTTALTTTSLLALTGGGGGLAWASTCGFSAAGNTPRCCKIKSSRPWRGGGV